MFAGKVSRGYVGGWLFVDIPVSGIFWKEIETTIGANFPMTYKEKKKDKYGNHFTTYEPVSGDLRTAIGSVYEVSVKDSLFFFNK